MPARERAAPPDGAFPHAGLPLLADAAPARPELRRLMAARLTANQVFWMPAACLEALHLWVMKHGRVPSASADWARAGRGHPSEMTARRHFGSWTAFIRAGGYEPRGPGCAPGLSEPGETIYWTRERIRDWMLDELLRCGDWPTVPSLRRAQNGERRPSYCTVIRAFGSFTAAKRFAGWNSTCRGCDRPLPRGSRAYRKWCSNRCRHRAEHRTRRSTRCVGCGGELTERTFGCRHCINRANKRATRERQRHELATTTEREPDAAALGRRAA